ncbi:MAG: SBBP repeat-containing protein [Cytophagaceae bacterium]|jgi:sugar lactone lactonase YvrE|nr:SBBP repeat-containing protein [Cytophagaceae bacterium]
MNLLSKKIVILAFTIAVVYSNRVYAQEVNTLAGTGTVGSADGAGISSSFHFPYGVAIHPLTGELYVADTDNHKIRKINSSGVVSTFAGLGTSGFKDGSLSVATFSSPTGIAIDSLGNFYVADYANNRIRKISASGVVSTFAGSLVNTPGTIDGNGTEARFTSPTGVAVDSTGNVYVADLFSHKIRKITPAGQVSTLAGSGIIGFQEGSGSNARFNRPTGVAVDWAGNVYVADWYNHRIRKVTPQGDVSTLAGSGAQGSSDGPGNTASFLYPYGIAVDRAGNVYVADGDNHKIRKITPSGTVSTLAGTGVAGSDDGTGVQASFNFPSGICVDSIGFIYVADTENHKIRKISNQTVTALNDGSIANTIQVYPNPAVDQLTIQGAIGSTVEISNVMGQTVFRSEMKHADMNINTSDWAKNSLYLVKIVNANTKTVYITNVLVKH